MDEEKQDFLQFRIHVIEAKHLKSRDDSKSSDPFVSVQVFDQTQSTPIIYDTMNCTWDKSFFFEFNDTPKHTLETGKISFTVYDSNTWKRNTIIGSYDMDVSYILDNKINKQWLVLSDPTDTYEGTQGFLNVSVSAIKNGEQIEYDNRNDENKNSDLLLPVNIKKDEYVLICTLYCIEYTEEENIFVSLRFGNGQRCCSSAVFNKTPVYNQELYLPITFPSMSDLVEITILSRNGLIETMLCSYFLHLSSISKRKEKHPKWYHISHLDNDDNRFYKASLLANIYRQKVETAKVEVFDLIPDENHPGSCARTKVLSDTKQQHMLLVSKPPIHECVLTCNLYECHNVSSSFLKQKYHIEISYKENSVLSSFKNVTNDKTLSFKEKISTIFKIEKNIDNQDDVYVYLKQDTKTLGSSIIKLTDLVEIQNPTWIQLGKAHLLTSLLVYKKTQIPKNDCFIECKSQMFEFMISIYQGIFQKYGYYRLEFQINDKTTKSTLLTKRSVCDWYETTKIKIQLPENQKLLPILYVKLIDFNECVDTIHILPHCYTYPNASNIKEYIFENVKGKVNLKLELCPVGHIYTMPPMKSIIDTYICRFVLIGIRNFNAPFLSSQLKFNIHINEETQATSSLPNGQNTNIMNVFDFIVNQYALVQYAIIDIEDTTLYSNKIGEAVLKIENKREKVSNQINEIDNESIRDDIPSYLQNRKLLRGSIEHYYKTCQPFDTWEIKNIQNKCLGNLVGYVRKFDVKHQMISHENEKSVFMNEKVVVRVYILRCLDLIAKDLNGSSDPYVLLQLGKESKKTRVIKETLDPEFHEMIEFKNVIIPRDGYVNISVYDWDMTTSDDLIGSTYIDITNRWYHDEWNDMLHKPLEMRTLNHKHASGPQGVIELWVDIISSRDAKIYKPIDISLPPPKPFVIRLIVWNAKELSCDDANNMNDVYISGTFNDDKKCTDIHWRSANRRANFNYRLIWDIELPIKKLYSKLTIQAWDQDIIGESDLIGEGVIDMHELFKAGYTTLLPQRYNENKRDTWVELFHSDYPNISRGFVRVSLEVVTKFYANQHPAGHGRDAPNINPTLQEPIRPSFQITRPLDLLADVLGPEMFQKLKLTTYIFCLCGPFFGVLWIWVQIKHAFGIKYSWE